MIEEWISTTPETLALIALTAVGIYVAVLTLTRIAGLRSFAQMSAFDFAMSVAVGTTLASTVLTSSVSLSEGAFALACLFGLQTLIGWTRQRSQRISRLVDNQPLLLVDGGEILHRSLKTGRVSESDLYKKLREAGVRSLSEVEVAVFETTGDISVVRRPEPAPSFDRSLLRGVVDDRGRDVV